jgi:hypothetical protein
MRAHELELLVPFCLPHDLHHRLMERVHGLKRLALPRALRDPRRMLEDTAEARREVALRERIRLLEPHAR